MTRPVIVPSAVNPDKVTKLSKQKMLKNKELEEKNAEKALSSLQNLLDEEIEAIDDNKLKTLKTAEEQPKRGRGRPKKVIESKVEKEENTQSNINLFDLYDDVEQTVLSGINEEKQSSVLPGLEEDETDNTVLPGLEKTMEETIDNLLPGFEAEEPIEDVLPEIENEQENISQYNNTDTSEILEQNITRQNIDITSLLSKDKKIVSFVGTSKNGTSFLVNNLGEFFSSMGIRTAILDVTQNKNSYYIYTKNEEELRKIALSSIDNLAKGEIGGIKVNNNLTVYTSLPTGEINENHEEILATLVKNYSLVLIDCDFDTDIEYFKNSQEIYLIQSMDILTIQSLTAFLRDLKSKNILLQDKIRIVINKQTKIRGLNPKIVIGGMAYYNDPSMSFMTELFNKDIVRYCAIPFDEQVYSKYLEGLVNCNVSLNGYSKNFMASLKELGNMVYPLLSNKYKPVDNYDRKK